MQDALEEGFVRRANPKGIVSFSPGLRGTSYPGLGNRMYLNPERVESLANVCDATLSGLGKGNLATQGRPSLNRANPGLNDPIPSGLKRIGSKLEDQPCYSTENVEEPRLTRCQPLRKAVAPPKSLRIGALPRGPLPLLCQ